MESLIGQLPPSAAPLRRKLQKGLKTSRLACKELSEWRDRRVAHRDEATALEEHVTPLEPVKQRSVGETIEFCHRTFKGGH